MKRLLIIFLLAIYPVLGQAQSNVFILVDVSKSVTQQQLDDARQALTEVLTASDLSKAFIAQGSGQDLANFRIQQDDKLAISRFGSLQTTLAMNPDLTPVQNITADVSRVINSISWVPTDNQTYITLAKAKVAEYAKNHGITKYKLYIISDNVQDDYGQGGRPNYSNDDYIRNLAEGYNTSTNPVTESGYTKLKFAANSLFTLSFSPGVDVSKYNLPLPVTGSTNQNPIQPVMQDTTPVIKLTSYAGGKKGKEIEIRSEMLNISWACQNCPQGIKYKVIVSPMDGGKKDIKSGLSSTALSLKEPDGSYKIQVISENYPQASSDTTYVTITTGGMGGLLFFLILLLIVGIGLYLWNKKRQQRVEAPSRKAEDIFSKSSNTSSDTSSNISSGPSSNSDYF